MAGAICAAKVSEAQCFQGTAAETWRVAAHRQWRRWAFGGGRIRAELPKLLWAGGGRKLATGALSGRIWRKLQRGAAGRGALLAGSAELLLGGGAGGFTEMATGPQDTGAVWRGRQFWGKRRRCFQKTTTADGTS